ncbi:hypothetical protein [Shinella pollutisoli]|uniref:Transposase n=1 Tax=Shinella pollutisoli TaxID=2250594 RepID=A0ABV7DAK6_9HYPH|nr:hypothetical protein [Shinella pollutisoli]
MKTQESPVDGTVLAVRVRGSGFYYAIRHFVGEAVEARRRRIAARRVTEDLQQLSPYLQRDIGWPSIDMHERS